MRTWTTRDVRDKEGALHSSHGPGCYQLCLPNGMCLCKGRNKDVHFSMEGHLDSLQQVFRIRDLMCCFSETEMLE